MAVLSRTFPLLWAAALCAACDPVSSAPDGGPQLFDATPALDAAPPSVDATPPADAVPLGPLTSGTCDELPFTLANSTSAVCIQLLDDGGCEFRESADGCQDESWKPGFEVGLIEWSPDTLETTMGRTWEIIEASGGDVSHRRIDVGQFGSSVSGMPVGEDVSVTVRRNARDWRELSFRAEPDGLVLLALTAVETGADCPSKAGHAVPYQCTRYNAPTWTLEDIQLLSHTGGMLGTGLAVFDQHKWYEPAGPMGPDALNPHAPPYDSEASDSSAREGFVNATTFAVSDWTLPSALFLFAIVVPDDDAPIGSSPDFESGPIVDFRGKPLFVDADLYRDGVLVDADFDDLYPKLSTIVGAPAGDSYSHVPLGFGEHTSFIPGTPGDYEWHLRVLDIEYNGWNVIVPFTVTP